MCRALSVPVAASVAVAMVAVSGTTCDKYAVVVILAAAGSSRADTGSFEKRLHVGRCVSGAAFDSYEGRRCRAYPGCWGA